MSQAPTTQVSLLIRIRDGANHVAWQEFVRLYGPVVYGFARKRGLQDADAADLMQDVLRSVSGAISRLEYDRKQGTFRGWLFTISRNKVLNYYAARKSHPPAAGDSGAHRSLDNVADRDGGAETWELEYQRRIAGIAMEKIKSEFQANTWQAFWATAVEGTSATEVAKLVGMSPGAVYVAKSRVLARLKTEVQALQSQED